jgi:alpha-beta hydrolase superfamily lysophospholipase
MGFTEKTVFRSATGAALSLRHEAARGDAAGVVQINHGLAEHSARYATFASELSDAGFHVYAHDHRGHGFTEAPDAPPGSFDAKGNGASLVIDDIASVHAMIAENHPGLPVFIFGHSMGGLVTLNYLLRHPDSVAGAAIWNANFSAGLLGRVAQGLLGWERFRLGSDVPSRILPALTFDQWAKSVKDRRTDFDWLSHDEQVVDDYVADPLCGWYASVGMWQDVFRFVFAGADDRKLGRIPRDLPLHLIGGDRDPATDGGKAVAALASRLKRLGFNAVKSRVLPETRHESLNDTISREITGEVIDWLRKKIPSS